MALVTARRKLMHLGATALVLLPFWWAGSTGLGAPFLPVHTTYTVQAQNLAQAKTEEDANSICESKDRPEWGKKLFGETQTIKLACRSKDAVL